MHEVGLKAVWVMVVTVWLTWAMAMSEVGNARWGTTQTLPIAASQAGAAGDEPWQEPIVTLTHSGARGLGLIIVWSLLVVGGGLKQKRRSKCHLTARSRSLRERRAA